MAWSVREYEGPDENSPFEDVWSVSDAVVPFSSGSKTDILLVQAMLETYMLSNLLMPEDKAKAMDILETPPGRFVDGYYGPKTRRAILFFENKIGSPYKDGVVRSLGDISKPGAPHRFTKMSMLNTLWDMVMANFGEVNSRQEQGRLYLPQSVYTEMYGKFRGRTASAKSRARRGR